MQREESTTDPFSLLPHSREKFQYLALFDIQQWYPSLAEHTMPTLTLPLSVAEGKALVCAYESQRLGSDDDDGGHSAGQEEEEEWRSVITSLKTRVQQVIETMEAEQGKFLQTPILHLSLCLPLFSLQS